MKTLVLNALTRLHRDERGQGLTEYLLVLTLVALAAITGMSTLANDINSAFLAIGGKLGVYATPQ